MVTRDEQPVGVVRAVRLLSACAPPAVGVFGWLTAHLLTFWLLAHSHGRPLSPAGRTLHHYTETAALLVGCLAAASLLAVLLTRPRRNWPQPTSAHRAATARRAVWMSTLAFASAELVEHAMLSADRKPPVILLAGLLLHALAGALTTVTWHHYRDAVHRMWATTEPVPAACRTPPAHITAPPPAPRRHLCGSCITGRAPPALVFV